MAASVSPVRTDVPNRRRRVRHKIQTPAYATFAGEPKGAVLELFEIVNLSEDGIAIQCSAPLEADRCVDLLLDLAGSAEHIYTTGQVIWTNQSGRVGLRFSELLPTSLSRLREWLFLNAMTGAPAQGDMPAAPSATAASLRPDYSDTLAAVAAVQREVEALGSNLAGALQLIAMRTQKLLLASGTALALADETPGFMVCRANSGEHAPPIGAKLQVGWGFSGECVSSGRLLRCDNPETDPYVDRESCRALGIQSILAAPLRAGERTIGILEAFSPDPSAFGDDDGRVLQRLAEMAVEAVNRSAAARDLPLPGAPTHDPFEPRPGSVLFASEVTGKAKEEVAEKKAPVGIALPRSNLYLLVGCAAAIFLVLGYVVAQSPWIQGKLNKLRERGQGKLQTVLASSPSTKPGSPPAESSSPSVETATPEELLRMAENGNAAAENALGLRYSEGDEKNGIRQDEKEAFRWFSKAAEDGSLSAQAKIGFLYWTGRGVAKDPGKAYFWTVLARARGDEANKELATVLASGMKRRDAAEIEQQAEAWLRRHPGFAKPAASP